MGQVSAGSVGSGGSRKTRSSSWMEPKLGLDLTVPAGEPALIAPDSVSWQVFKNPIAMFVGGVTAVILELAEPRVRSGVWDHSTFRRDPLGRMQRTGVAAMITVYGSRSLAEKRIAAVYKMHSRVQGETPDGVAYYANDPELLDWVQTTATFGFLEAYSAYVRPLGRVERDRIYDEARVGGALFGAVGAPRDESEAQRQFHAMRTRLERSDIVFEFLDIMRNVPAVPAPLRPLQRMLVGAAVDITPAWVRETLGLDASYGLSAWQRALVRGLGRFADRFVPRSSPAAQACQRLGLSTDVLYPKRS